MMHLLRRSHHARRCRLLLTTIALVGLVVAVAAAVSAVRPVLLLLLMMIGTAATASGPSVVHRSGCTLTIAVSPALLHYCDTSGRHTLPAPSLARHF